MNSEQISEAVNSATEDVAWSQVSSHPVEMSRFGKDHWSTFLYLETRCVDYQGKIDHNHMRCDEKRHPIFAGAKTGMAATSGLTSGSEYPTRIKGEFVAGKWGVEEVNNHDDYDCLCDLIAAGLVEVVMPDVSQVDAPQFNGQKLITGLVEKEMETKATFRLTPIGWEIAGKLRQWRASGNSIHSFQP